MSGSDSELLAKIREAEKLVKVGGTYRHYKSADMTYEVLALAFEEATLEVVVVYKALYGDMLTFTRPVRVWLENVDFEGQTRSRFTPLD